MFPYLQLHWIRGRVYLGIVVFIDARSEGASSLSMRLWLVEDKVVTGLAPETSTVWLAALATSIGAANGAAAPMAFPLRGGAGAKGGFSVRLLDANPGAPCCSRSSVLPATLRQCSSYYWSNPAAHRRPCGLRLEVWRDLERRLPHGHSDLKHL